MTSLVETNKHGEDNAGVNKMFEIELPVNYSLAKFLSKSLPEPNICEFLGIDIKPKYTLFNLYGTLSKHLKYKGKAEYYIVTDKLREAFSLPNDEEMSKAKIMNYVMMYVKKNNLQFTNVWYKTKVDDVLRELFFAQLCSSTEVDIWDLENALDIQLKNAGEPIYYNIYSLSKEMAEFMNVSENYETDNVKVLQKCLEYIKTNNLQNPHNKVEILPDDKLMKLLN